MLSDFSNDQMFFGKGIIVKGNSIQSASNNNLWYIPFDKNAKPILLNSNKLPGSGSGPEIDISCYCTGSNQILCDIQGTNVLTCEGPCISITNPASGGGTCKMKVTISGGKNSINASTGIIVASETVVFNGVTFK